MNLGDKLELWLFRHVEIQLSEEQIERIKPRELALSLTDVQKGELQSKVDEVTLSSEQIKQVVNGNKYEIDLTAEQKQKVGGNSAPLNLDDQQLDEVLRRNQVTIQLSNEQRNYLGAQRIVFTIPYEQVKDISKEKPTLTITDRQLRDLQSSEESSPTGMPPAHSPEKTADDLAKGAWRWIKIVTGFLILLVPLGLIFSILGACSGPLPSTPTQNALVSPSASPTATGTAEISPSPTLTTTEDGPALGNTQPGASPSSSPTTTGTPETSPSPTLTTVSGNAAIAANTQPATSPSPSSTPSGESLGMLAPTGSAPQPTREAGNSRYFTVGQQYLVLGLLISIPVLFPLFLLYAFAIQQVPRLAKDLEADLEKLGIEPSHEDQEGAGATNSGKGDDENAKRASRNQAARKEVNRRFGASEFLVAVVPLTVGLLAVFEWAFLPLGTYDFGRYFVTEGNSLHTYVFQVISGLSVVLAAFLTGYAFITYGLVRRYFRSDITPGAFWFANGRLFVAFLLGIVLTALFSATPSSDALPINASKGLAILAGVFVGVFPLRTLQMIVRVGQAALVRFFSVVAKEGGAQQSDALAERLFPKHELAVLDDLDEWDMGRLEEEGIIGVQGMATADIVDLVTWTPFPTTQIVDWVDQAILYMAAGAEPDMSYVRLFRSMGLRGASDLLDATRNLEGIKRVVLAAETIRGKIVDDPVRLAELAGLRAQLKVADALEKVKGVKDKNKDDDTEGISAALAAVGEAYWLVGDAFTQVKNGGDRLKDALDKAQDLQKNFESIPAAADKVQSELVKVTDKKVSAELAEALKSLGEGFPSEVSENAKKLADKLQEIAEPLRKIQSSAKAFQDRAAGILVEAEKAEGDGGGKVPDKVSLAKEQLDDLSNLAQDTKKRIDKDPSLTTVSTALDNVIDTLTQGDKTPEKLLGPEKLAKEEQWKEKDPTVGNPGKVKAYADAQTLVDKANQIMAFVESGEKALEKVRAAATYPSALPLLTREVLETILSGLEKNPNLRRIQRYLTEATNDVPKPTQVYISNNGWG